MRRERIIHLKGKLIARQHTGLQTGYKRCLFDSVVNFVMQVLYKLQ